MFCLTMLPRALSWGMYLDSPLRANANLPQMFQLLATLLQGAILHLSDETVWFAYSNGLHPCLAYAQSPQILYLSFPISPDVCI